jgi:carboxyl-terminal processing protease
VVPDVILPDSYEYVQFREKDDPYAMQWDEIRAAKTTYTNSITLSSVIEQSKARVNASKAFNTIKANAQTINSFTEKPYSLNLQISRQEQAKLKELGKQLDEVSKTRDSLSVRFMAVDEVKYYADKDKTETNKRFLNLVGKDMYIAEAVNVMHDLLKTGGFASAKN